MTTPEINLADYYVPTPKQAMFHASDADFLLYGGAAGGGKSTAEAADAMMICLHFPGCQAYMFRKTYSELEDSLIRVANEIIPSEIARYISNRHMMEFVNGSTIRFRHLHNPKDKTRYQSAEMNALYIDELTHFTEEEFDYLRTRVRAGKKLGMRPFVRAGTNPGGIGHAWVKKRFVDPHPFGGRSTQEVYSEVLKRTEVKTFEYLPATVKDNPHISSGYIYELESKPAALREALLLGKWDVFEGQAFMEFTNDLRHYNDGFNTHVINPFPIPDHWPHWCSLDWGYAKPFSVGWWAVDPVKDIIYRYDEWYGSTGAGNVGLKLDVDQAAEGIIEREKAITKGMMFTRVADPHLWDEDGSVQGSIERAFRRKGLYFKPGDNTRMAGKMQLHYRLRGQEIGRDANDNPIWVPKIYVFHTCKEWIRTIPALTYNETNVALKAEDINTEGEDHCYDETRYMLMNYKVADVPPPKQETIWKPPAISPLGGARKATGTRYVPN